MFFDGPCQLAMMEALEARRLLSVTAYDWRGASVGTTPQSPFVSTGNAGDYHYKEPGLNATPPASGYTPGHPTGGGTSMSLGQVPKHTELVLGVGWGSHVQGMIPVGIEGEEEPTGYWHTILNFGPYQHWWKTGIGEGGDPLTFSHFEDSLSVNITSTWVGDHVSAANWWLTSLSVTRRTPTVSVAPVDTAEEGVTVFPPGQQPGFIVSRAGDTELGALLVNLAVTSDGTAQSVADYDLLPESVLIPAGESEVLVPLTAVDDDEIEWTESVEMEVRPGDHYLLPAPPTPGNDIFATVQIRDNDGVDIEAPGLPEEWADEEYNETNPGLYLVLNDDDDDENGTIDGWDEPVGSSDNELGDVILRFPDEQKIVGSPPNEQEAEVTLSLSSSRFRVWHSGELLLGGPLGPEMAVQVEFVPEPPPEPSPPYSPYSESLWEVITGLLTLSGNDVGPHGSPSTDVLLLQGMQIVVDLDDPALTADEETRYGTFVMINADNDNGSPVAEMWPETRDFQVASGAQYHGGVEDDLKELQVILRGAAVPRWVKLTWTQTHVRVFRSADKTDEMQSGDLLTVNQQGSIYLEGVNINTNLKAITFTAQLLDFAAIPVAGAVDKLRAAVGPIAISGRFREEGDPQMDPHLDDNPTLHAHVGQPFGELFPPTPTALEWEYDAAFHPGVDQNQLKFVQTVANSNLLPNGVGIVTTTNRKWKLQFGTVNGVDYAGEALLDGLRPEDIPFFIPWINDFGQLVRPLSYGSIAVDLDGDGHYDVHRYVEGDKPAVPLQPIGIGVGESADVHLRMDFDLHFVLHLEGIIYPLMMQDWEVVFHGTMTRQEPERYVWTTPAEGSQNRSGAQGHATISHEKPRTLGPVLANVAARAENGGGLVEVTP